MSKLLINLLPAELREETKRQERRSRITKISVLLIVVVIIITSSILGFRFFVNEESTKANQLVSEAENQISGLRKQEELITVLRNRVSKISTLLGQESFQVQAFNLVYALTPEDITLISFDAKNKGEIDLAGETSGLQYLNDFFGILTDPKKNEGRLGQVVVESLSADANKSIKFNLSINVASLSASRN